MIRAARGLLALAALGGPLLSQSAPTRTGDRGAAERLVARLDRAFEQRDVDTYLAAFAHRSWLPMLLLRRRLEHVLRAGPMRRRSRILRSYQSGGKCVALVESEYRCAAASDAGVPTARTHSLLVFEEPAAEPRALLELPCGRPHSSRIDANGVFCCMPCNYRIGTSRGWLPVEHAPARAGCAEAVSFYSLERDTSLEVSVLIGMPKVPARRALSDMLEDLHRSMGIEAEGPIESWLPARYRTSRGPAPLTGARVRGHWRIEGSRRTVILHLLTFGPMRYVLAAHGTDTSLQAGAEALEDLLATFELVDPRRSETEMATIPLRAHTGGGSLEGTRFSSVAHRVRFEGPKHWKATLCAGPWAFSVRYACPGEGGVLDVTAYPPPPGFTRWTAVAADADLERMVRRLGHQVIEDTGWVEPPGSASRRELHTRAPDPASGGTRELFVRLVRFDDLLVVLVGHIHDPAVREDVRRAFESLQRL